MDVLWEWVLFQEEQPLKITGELGWTPGTHSGKTKDLLWSFVKITEALKRKVKELDEIERADKDKR